MKRVGSQSTRIEMEFHQPRNLFTNETQMRLKSVKITNFKRFHSLSIDDIPATSKLVILTGPNGSGKTSLFEAFNSWSQARTRRSKPRDNEYYDRELRATLTSEQEKSLTHTLHGRRVEISFHNINEHQPNDPEKLKRTFYLRTAYRHTADFTFSGIHHSPVHANEDPLPTSLITAESRVQGNYSQLVYQTVSTLYDKEQSDRTAGDITNELIGKIRKAMQEVFNDLILEGPGNPLKGGTFRFTKGAAQNFHYKNLSGGEKAAFDLILDFIIRTQEFNDTIFCIDEPELHMHTRLQSKLLRTMYNLIPDSCQLWISTHSIGMARTARELHRANPGEVSFIDFHDHDFDEDVQLKPTYPDRMFWKNMFDTALDDLSQLIMPDYIVFCEGGQPKELGTIPSFDAEVYKIIFSQRYPNVEFISLGGSNEVNKNGRLIGSVITHLSRATKTWIVIDRDDHSKRDISDFACSGVQVLERRAIENYLWDDEILELFLEKHGYSTSLPHLLQFKKEALAALVQQEKPTDDIKSICGMLYNECKKITRITGCGNNARSFAINQLAHLISPGTAVYEELERIIMAPILDEPNERGLVENLR